MSPHFFCTMKTITACYIWENGKVIVVKPRIPKETKLYMYSLCVCVCVVLEQHQTVSTQQRRGSLKALKLPEVTGDDSWRIQTPLVFPKEKAAVSAPSTAGNGDTIRVKAAH